MVRPAQALILIVTGLLVLGVVAVHSAGLTVGRPGSTGFTDLLFHRTTLLAILAMGALLLGLMTSIDGLHDQCRGRIPLLLVVIPIVLLLLVQATPLGREVHGARRWIDLGPVGFQPSELAKWGLVIFLACFIVRKGSAIQDLRHGFAPAAAVVFVTAGLIGIEDLGTAIVLVLVGMMMLVAGGCRFWHAILPIPVAAVGIAAALIASPYRINRLRAFVDPYADAQGIGYHVLQSMSAISGGGLAGRGLGNGVQKFGYLPEDTTDFLFAIICEELGLTGCLLVMVLYAALLLVGLRIIQATHRPLHRLLGFGIVLTISIQALVNLAVVTGLAPTKGIALPLLSSGGTGWIMVAYCIGLLGSIDRSTRRHDRSTDAGPGLQSGPLVGLS